MDQTLPRLLVIADGFTAAPLRERVIAMATAQMLPWVQLRDHTASPDEFTDVARELTSEIRRLSPRTLISVNGYPDLAAELGVGLHLGFRSIQPVVARSKFGSSMLIGYSAHSDSHIAVIAHCHYITFSPVFPVQKSPSVQPLGLDRLRHITGRTDTPVFALGSISVSRVGDCLRAGAYGVAALSGVMASPDSVEAVSRYLSAIEGAVEVH
jgi:thiamine-phosphate diphosphorylase